MVPYEVINQKRYLNSLFLLEMFKLLRLLNIHVCLKTFYQFNKSVAEF